MADYVSTIRGEEVLYSRRSAALGDIALVGRGRLIEIQDWRNRESVLAALELSQAKWERITVTGNDQYKALCAELAGEHGFHIVNPESQASSAASVRREQPNSRSKKSVGTAESPSHNLQNTIPRLRKRLNSTLG